jgi:DNA-binding NarL/FixJ family response regulator
MVDTVLSVVLQHHNRLLREMLAAHLTREPDIAVVGTAASGPELIQLCDLRRPLIVLFEVDGPRWNNERLMPLLLPPGRHTRLIGLHQSLTRQHLLQAREAGVSALVAYSDGLEPLLAAMRTPSSPAERAKADALTLLSQARGPRPNGSGQDRRPNLRVALAKLDGPVAARARKALERQRVVILDRKLMPPPHDRASDANLSQVVTVLIDPPASSWRGGAGRLVVIVSEEPPDHLKAQAVVSGVTLLPVSLVDRLLVPAVEAANAGHVLISTAYSRSVLGPQSGDWRRWQLALTPREQEILSAIAQGHTTKETASLLGISVRTVENLQGNLFRKLRVHRKAAALVVAHELGLLNERS